MLPKESFAPFFYALTGALAGGVVLFFCIQLWRWVHRRQNSLPYDNPSLFDVRLVKHAEPSFERKWHVDALTPRELEIALLAAQGKRTGDIARQLSISPYTVETHLKNIYKKLGVTSRLELAHVLNSLDARRTH